MVALQDDAARKVEILEKKVREYRREVVHLVEKIFFDLDEGVSDIRQELARQAANKPPPATPLPATPPAYPSIPYTASTTQADRPTPATSTDGPRPSLELVSLSVLAKSPIPVPASEIHKAAFAAGRKKAGADKALANLRIGGYATCVKRRWGITEAGRVQQQMLQRIFEERIAETETAPEDRSDAAQVADVAQR